jgi:hypothetical protein
VRLGRGAVAFKVDDLGLPTRRRGLARPARKPVPRPSQRERDRAEFDSYFTGTDVAIAIELAGICRLACPRPLAELRRDDASFRPPQSFRYLEPERAAALL